MLKSAKLLLYNFQNIVWICATFYPYLYHPCLSEGLRALKHTFATATAGVHCLCVLFVVLFVDLLCCYVFRAYTLTQPLLICPSHFLGKGRISLGRLPLYTAVQSGALHSVVVGWKWNSSVCLLVTVVMPFTILPFCARNIKILYII